MAEVVNLTLENCDQVDIGASYERALDFTDGAGADLDVSSNVFSMKIKDKTGATILSLVETVSTTATGIRHDPVITKRILIQINKAQTVLVAANIYRYDLADLDPDTTEDIDMRGDIEFVAGVTLTP